MMGATVPKRACRVFLVGEGPSDIGDLAHRAQYRGDREGFIQPILRSLVADVVDLSFFDGLKLSLVAGRRRPLTRGHQRKAEQAVRLAAAENADAVVYVVDVDRSPGEPASSAERRRQTAALREQIHSGFDRARASSPVLATVVATPCRMIESWALGDREALHGATGGRANSAAIPARPEELWGIESDRASNHPKCVLRRVLGRDAGRADFEAIGTRCRPEALEESCPHSFRPFADDVRRRLAECSLRR